MRRKNNITYELLNKIIKDNNISNDVILQSDSGWECSETDINCIYYCKSKNIIIFTQYFSENDDYNKNDDFELLYGVHLTTGKVFYNKTTDL